MGICIRNGRYHGEFTFNPEHEYRMYIGMNNHFGKVTFSWNKAFGYDEAQSRFPKEDLRVFVTSEMNEASPRYAEGVKNGGKHLMKDGKIVRDLKENGMNLINFEPGYASFAYDARLGGDFHLEDALPSRMIRNRFPLMGNMITMTHRQGRDGVFNVHVKSLSSDHQSEFVGTDAEWQKERRDVLSYGDKYIVNLPTPHEGMMLKENDMFYAGTQCKSLNNVVYNTLNTRMKENDKTPAVLLLGGDRSQTIGSMSGAFRAYEDLCCVFMDAQFNFRDPHMNKEFGVTHGTGHYLLFQELERRHQEMGRVGRRDQVLQEPEWRREVLGRFEGRRRLPRIQLAATAEPQDQPPPCCLLRCTRQGSEGCVDRQRSPQSTRHPVHGDVASGEVHVHPADDPRPRSVQGVEAHHQAVPRLIPARVPRREGQAVPGWPEVGATNHGVVGRRLHRPQGLPMCYATRSSRNVI